MRPLLERIENMRKTVRGALLAAAAIYVALVALEATAWGKMEYFKKAKELGYPAHNCMYCHTVKLPKKEGFSPKELNERGKWLLEQKEKHKAKEVDVTWLKDYPGGKE
jgi:hypothetical protein